jgi:two-component system sensor histidine kinase KdpD
VHFRRGSVRILVSLGCVALVTFIAHKVIPVNATTVGFAYLLLVLVIASAWGFFEAALSSIAATLVFNFFFFPPVGTFTIADPQNWVALFSFLATSLVASRLSTKVKARALEAVERRLDVERLYSFSRAILLIDQGSPFPKQLVEKLAKCFKLDGAVLYDKQTGEFYRVGGGHVPDIDERLRGDVSPSSPVDGSKLDPVIMNVTLGSAPVARLALNGARMPDSVFQGIANLVAIGLDRARAQDLAQQVEAARQSEQLRTTLIDAMAHEFKTPLTLIKAATTSLLSNPNQPLPTRAEQLRAADEEADHLRDLIDDSVEMARLDTAHIDVHPEVSDLTEALTDVLASMQADIEDHSVHVTSDSQLPLLAFDKRLIKLAIKQLIDNAIKYSPAQLPVEIGLHGDNGSSVALDITDFGKDIPPEEQKRIFERFY